MQIVSKLLLAFAIAGSIAAAAQTPNQTPDLSGTWKLNRATSYFGGEHPAAAYELTKTIVAKGAAITMTDVQVHHEMMNIPLPDSTTTTELTTDGKEYPGQVNGRFPGQPPTRLTTATEWQGGTLFIRRVGVSTGPLMNVQIRYYLSTDNSQLIELMESHGLFGDSDQRLVFVRMR